MLRNCAMARSPAFLMLAIECNTPREARVGVRTDVISIRYLRPRAWRCLLYAHLLHVPSICIKLRIGLRAEQKLMYLGAVQSRPPRSSSRIVWGFVPVSGPMLQYVMMYLDVANYYGG